MNLNKFKDILKENWVFDEGDFIYILNKALFETNKVIKNDLSSKMDNYSDKIENEINKYLEDNIENIIDEYFSIQFEYLIKHSDSVANYIIDNIISIINTIRSNIKSEAKRIENNPGVYLLNPEKIKGIIEDYEKEIIKQFNNSVCINLEGFTKNMYNNIYLNCILPKLNQYLNEAKLITSLTEFGEYNLVNSSYKIGEVIYNLTETIINNYKIMVKKKIDFKYKNYYDIFNTVLYMPENYQFIINELNYTYEKKISYVLNSQNNCSSSQCQEFTFTNDTITQINNTMNQKMNNIINKILSSKGNNYNVNFQCPLDFTNSGINIIKPICESFKNILSSENQEQATLINGYIQDYIRSNLDDFLNNVVPTFGNPFFERIIDYNINFKIVDLYHNLRYALAQTMLYYYILNAVRDVSDLPYELKMRLYQLNNLDLTIQIKKEDIKQLLERKLSELIKDLKDTAKETYTYHLKENDVIKKSFNSRLLERIDYNLEEIMDDLDKKYQEALEKYLKEKFIASFNEILEIKTEEMLEVFYKERNKLMLKFDELFSSKEDNDLKDVNKKINLTLDSIQNYHNFADSFEISKNVIYFFMDYGLTTFRPLFLKFEKDLNNKMKSLIIDSINKKSLTIANLSPNNIYNNILAIQNYFAKNYYFDINLAIESYGKERISYGSNLNFTRKIIYEKLMNKQNGDDLEEEAKKLVESRDVQETLILLYNRAYNNYNGIINLNAIKDFNNKINKYKNELNIDYIMIKELITENKYNDEIISFLNGKVSSLQNKLNNYYNGIYNQFNSLYNILKNNMTKVKDYLSKCESETEWAIYYLYSDIRAKTKNINNKYSNSISQYDQKIEYEAKSDHMTNNAKAYLSQIKEYAEFILDFNYGGAVWERPKLKAIIVDKSKPNNINLDFYSSCGECCIEGQIYNITLNGVNLTTTVEYDMKTSSIKINTYTNIDKYLVTESVYRKEQVLKSINEEFDGIVVNRSYCLKKENLTIYDKNITEISASNFTDLKIFTK